MLVATDAIRAVTSLCKPLLLEHALKACRCQSGQGHGIKPEQVETVHAGCSRLQPACLGTGKSEEGVGPGLALIEAGHEEDRLPMSQLDYGLIGNCQISALVEKSGKIAWCCMPRFDAPVDFRRAAGSGARRLLEHRAREPGAGAVGEPAALSAQHQRAGHHVHEPRRRSVRDRRLHAPFSSRAAA